MNYTSFTLFAEVLERDFMTMVRAVISRTVGGFVVKTKGQKLRTSEDDQKFQVVEFDDRVELIPVKTAREMLGFLKGINTETSLEDVASCLKYGGKAVSLDDMEMAIKRGAIDQYNCSR